MKKKYSLLVLFCIINTFGFSQIFQVNSGGELLNIGKLDLTFTSSIKWISDRSSQPGFFSILDTGSFTSYSDQNHINGYVKKYGNTPFIFPVGNGDDLRCLEISKPGKSTDAYATAWISGDPGYNNDPTMPYKGVHPTNRVTSPIISVMNNGQWDWLVGENSNLGDKTTGDGNGLNIRVSMPELSSFAHKSDLRLVGWNGYSWIDLSGKSTAENNTENSFISGIMIKDITAISIGKIKSETKSRMIVFPNPVIGETTIQVQLTTSYIGKIEINIYSTYGNFLMSNWFNCQAGINTYPIKISSLKSGSYFIKIRDANGIALFDATTFIKQ